MQLSWLSSILGLDARRFVPKISDSLLSRLTSHLKIITTCSIHISSTLIPMLALVPFQDPKQTTLLPQVLSATWSAGTHSPIISKGIITSLWVVHPINRFPARIALNFKTLSVLAFQSGYSPIHLPQARLRGQHHSDAEGMEETCDWLRWELHGIPIRCRWSGASGIAPFCTFGLHLSPHP